eukprot:1684756-Alexandrium_andersonii.AAC.1
MSATRNWPSSPRQLAARTRASWSALARSATPPPLPLPKRGAGCAKSCQPAWRATHWAVGTTEAAMTVSARQM